MWMQGRNKDVSMETKCLRSVCRLTWTSRVRNGEMRHIESVRKEMDERVGREILEWIEHVDQKEEEYVCCF